MFSSSVLAGNTTKDETIGDGTTAEAEPVTVSIPILLF